MSDVERVLLLTDVVDSTRRVEELGAQGAADLWAAHDRVARDLLPPWRGREIDKTDGMLLMFDTVPDAVGYALAYHRALTALRPPLSARAGIHAGAVVLRENSAADVARGAKPLEVDGLAKPTAARVMALARGGQTLLSGSAAQALGATALARSSHGHWALKGIAEPIEICEVGLDAAALSVPADGEKGYRVVRVGERWLPVQEIPNNLPQQANAFLGREQELAEVKALLERSRLVTLVGMGGLGKTRLGLQAAAELLPLFPQGVWFLDLAPLRDGALVVSEAAQVLDVRAEPGRTLLQTLCAHLKSRRLLIVLDNCEHLIEACAEFAGALLRAAPQLRLLASSRESLHVADEQIYPVLPLPLPRASDGIAELAQSTAVRLFVERAQRHKPSYALTEREAPAVVELVARLEGIPLALELAAARVRALSVADINLRLKDRFRLLAGGGRGLQRRQQTLREAVDWSYDLLGAGEQVLLQRLGAFVGGFDLAAAEAICGREPLELFEVIDMLASLVEKSLVMLDDRGAEPRYRMLETIRDYAREKLLGGDDAAPTQAGHGLYYLELAKQANRGLAGAEQGRWIAQLELELDNLREAIDRALAGALDAVVAVKFAVALQGFWILRGYATEGRRIVKAALARPEVQQSDRAHAHALYVGAALAQSQGDHAQARQMLEVCLALRRGLGDAFDIAATLSTLSVARLSGGDAAGARACETEALAIFRRIGAEVGVAIGLLHLGQIEAWAGDADRARAGLLECQALSASLAHQEVEGECEFMLGMLAHEAGDAVGA
ncbi:MAG: hypothetical protein KGJ30_15655, partial [Burkholderiales bacterium]|nr:hypothetical protein [Burkholderiales bacterium]